MASRRDYRVADTQPGLAQTELTADGCVKHEVLEGQGWGRTTYEVDAQTYADADAVMRVLGRGVNLCYVILAFSVLYLAASVLGFIYASNGTEFDLISTDRSAGGIITTSVSHTWPLAWITASALGVVFLIYGSFVAFAGRDYFTRQTFARAETLSGFLSFLLHAVFLGSIVFLWNGWVNHVSFYLLVFGGAFIITLGYVAILHEAALEEQWSFLTIIGFVVATVGNVGQWGLLLWTMATESLDTWVIFMTIIYILTNAAYWFNFLAWIQGWGVYSGVKTPRARYDIAGIVFVTILLAQMIGIFLLYWINDLL